MPGLPGDSGTQSPFVTALTRDHAGYTYAATKRQGIFRWGGHAWNQFTTQSTKNGLGSDDVYALAIDPKNRLWAGTLHGLSVFNGKDWKTYGPLEGVGGWRTFALAVSPKDGDVWCATEGDLARYSLHSDTWTRCSVTDGLPSDACSCLAFTSSARRVADAFAAQHHAQSCFRRPA